MSTFTTSDGLTLYYEDTGSGLPILCLAGLTRNCRDFDFVAPHLPGIRLIRLDYRGRGQSDWAKDFHTYNVVREGQDALELLDHLGLPSAAILGTSRGGLIAMILAATARHRLRGVALVDIGPELDLSGLEFIMGYLGKNPNSKTLAELAQARMAIMKPNFPDVPLERWLAEVTNTYTQTDSGVIINYDPKLRDAILATGAKGAEDEDGAASTPDLWPMFEAITGLPAAIIHGANSDLLSHATVDEMARRNPALIVAHVPNRAHIPFLDEPEALTALHQWIKEMS